MIKKSLSMIFTTLAIVSCVSDKSVQTPADALLERLSAQIEDGKIMFGHQDDLMYGHSWKLADDAAEYVQSDVFATCGKYPAVYGMDLGGIEIDSPANLDKNNFDHMRASAVAHHERGGVVTFSWHPRNPLTGGDAWDVSSDQVVASILPGGEKHEYFMTWLSKAADFMDSIRTEDGRHVPIIWRPWHEHTGSWFWWGEKLCSASEYKALWRMTVEQLSLKGVDNCLYAYSPGTEPQNEAQYLERYPGDDIIDLIGFDTYQSNNRPMYLYGVQRMLAIIKKIGKEHNKVIAITETGFEGVPDAEWWTGTLLPAIQDYPISYVLVWRNARERTSHHYAPYPGHPSANDFVDFYNEPRTLFAKDVDLYK